MESVEEKRKRAGWAGFAKSEAHLRAAAERQALEARARFEAESKLCPECTTPLEYEQRRNKFCSKTCSATFHNRKNIIPRNCAKCGKKIRGNGNCGPCTYLLDYEYYISDWKSGKNLGGSAYDVSGHVRRYLISIQGPSCWECGWSQINPSTGNVPIEVEHIDGNSSNHRESNLKLLCPNCHSLTPTYKALNKGNGRGHRRKALT